MPDTSRIEELQRRVQRDPASIAFAQLAEEYRRAGRFQEAVETCESGLARHPGYLSARVTLGRSLLEMGELESAQQQLDQVLRAAPENLAALRGVAEIHHRRGELPEALAHYRAALEFARHDPELELLVEQISHELEPHGSGPVVADGLSFQEVKDTFLNLSLPEVAADDLPEVAADDSPTVPPEVLALEATPDAEATGPTPAPEGDPVVEPEPPVGVEESSLAIDIELAPTAPLEAPPAEIGAGLSLQGPDADQELEAILQSLSAGVSSCPPATEADADTPATAEAADPATTTVESASESLTPALESATPAPESNVPAPGEPAALLTPFELAAAGAATPAAAPEPLSWDLPSVDSAAPQEPLESFSIEPFPACASEPAADPTAASPSASTTADGTDGGPQIEALQKWLDAIIADRQRQG